MQLHLLRLLERAEQWPPHPMNGNEIRFSAPHIKSGIEVHTAPVLPLSFTLT